MPGDLKNVLYSTNVATLFLDTDLTIGLFTPAAELLFGVDANDIGQPLSHHNMLAMDRSLLIDAQAVLRTLMPHEREIEAPCGTWYTRRILPCRTQENGVEGVVVTFLDCTERKRVSEALEAAKGQAQLSDVAKSRFLAAASHDLRQPLQTLNLLQGLLAKAVTGEKERTLVTRLAATLRSMTGMLNTLLDINKIESGAVNAEMVDFPIDELLDRLRDEFAYHAEAAGLTLRVVPCGLSIHSDPHLLEQMIRNLLSNALKYTEEGKVLLGCRRREGVLSIEIWDTGVGIPDEQLAAIFEEYKQLADGPREREGKLGLGLGLAIVQRLGTLLGHRVRVRSRAGKGSVFAVEVALPSDGKAVLTRSRSITSETGEESHRTGVILIVEDDPDVRNGLELLLKDEGHFVATAPDGAAALELMARGTVEPDLILADYELPDEMDGLQLIAKLRQRLHRGIPVVILTGDISSATLRQIAHQDCVQLDKPVRAQELTQVIQRLLSTAPSAASAAPAARPTEAFVNANAPVIFVVDDVSAVRETMRLVLEGEGLAVETFATCEAFLDAYHPGREACLLVDANLPGMTGLELLRRIGDVDRLLPAIMFTGNGDITTAVKAMQAGALDYMEKPVRHEALLANVTRALEQSRASSKLQVRHKIAAEQIASLTPREREVLNLILAGRANKCVAADLGISQRTVENHRAAIMRKTGTKSLPALARLALLAAESGHPASADDHTGGEPRAVDRDRAALTRVG